MADQNHLEVLKKGMDAWNSWRMENSSIKPDLAEADLQRMNLKGFNLASANLERAILLNTNLSGFETKLQNSTLDYAILEGADLSGAEMQSASLYEAKLTGNQTKLCGTSMMGSYLTRADFSGADLRKVKINDARAWYAKFNGSILNNAYLWGTDFRQAEFIKADLTGANIMCANFVMAKFEEAILSGCRVYGASIWDVTLKGATQHDLIVTNSNEQPVLVDDIEVAQFIHLLLSNEKIRNVIGTIAKKGVLILGRFGERLPILYAIKNKLRDLGYIPIIFDFERPTQRDFDETIKVLAGLCLFVIADITKPKSCPFELHSLVPDYMIPFMAIQESGEDPFAMFVDLQHKYPWVSDLVKYKNSERLIANLSKEIIDPALIKHDELVKQKSAPLRERFIE